ncbi:MAG: uncharacterized membrane protein YraQ (UPF0718 family) [Halobacteriales archaeon]|jgi:uncharacterized membrane protein YraQ (UPF0718 family)|uniref:hypothetical protein n=1 Tax=Natronomonas sp. TaxID=2184060 RepID=UPI003988E4C9
MGHGSRRKRLVASTRKAVRGLRNALPILASVVLLVGLLRTYVSAEMVSSVFGRRPFLDVALGTGIGSVSTGNAVTSYVIGGEILDRGVSLLAVTAFIVSWVTIGVVQFPAEASVLGRRFAIARNVTGAILAVLVSVGTVLVMGALA